MNWLASIFEETTSAVIFSFLMVSVMIFVYSIILKVKHIRIKDVEINRENVNFKDNLKLVLKSFAKEIISNVKQQCEVENRTFIPEQMDYVERKVDEVISDIEVYMKDTFMREYGDLKKLSRNFITDLWELYIPTAKRNVMKLFLKICKHNGLDKMTEQEFFEYKETQKKNIVQAVKKHSRLHNRLYEMDGWEGMFKLYDSLEDCIEEVLMHLRKISIEEHAKVNCEINNLQSELEQSLNAVLEGLE